MRFENTKFSVVSSFHPKQCVTVVHMSFSNLSTSMASKVLDAQKSKTLNTGSHSAHVGCLRQMRIKSSFVLRHTSFYLKRQSGEWAHWIGQPTVELFLSKVLSSSPASVGAEVFGTATMAHSTYQSMVDEQIKPQSFDCPLGVGQSTRKGSCSTEAKILTT